MKHTGSAPGGEQSNQSGFDFDGKHVTRNCHPDETFLGVPKVTAKNLNAEDIQFKRYLSGISLDECQVQEMMVRNMFLSEILTMKLYCVEKMGSCRQILTLK